MLEFMIVSVCAVAGWFGVSFLIGRWRRQRLPGRYADEPAAAWSKILGVEAAASQEVIRAAYKRRLAELMQARPTIVTAPETERLRAARQVLDLAFRESQNRIR